MAGRKPEEIGDIIKNIVSRLGEADNRKEADVQAAWEGAAGKRAAGHAQPVSLRKGILTVAVDNSAWLYQLTRDKKDLLGRLRKAVAQEIEDIKFRIK